MYGFSNLLARLKKQGVAITKSDFRTIVTRRDFTEDEEAGDAKLTPEGVFFIVNEKEVRGYLYIKEPDIQRYDNPKAHFIECRTIIQQKERNLFHTRYYWTNSLKVDLVDRVSHIEYPQVDLELCSNCLAGGDARGARTTNAFITAYGDEATIPVTVQTDRQGYTLDWHKISENYRTNTGYTCEHCGIAAKKRIHYRFFHVHHLDGDKINNAETNLKCLCLLCHTYVDDHHRKRMVGGFFKVHLEDYLVLYNEELLEKNRTQALAARAALGMN